MKKAAPNDNRDYMRALMAAYSEVTGIELELDYERRETCRLLDKKKLTPDDVRNVMRSLKALVESTDQRYTESSLLFSNAIGTRFNVQKFEERAMLLRRKKAKAKAAPSTPANAKTEVSAEEQTRLAAAAKEQAAALRKQLFGGQQ